MNDAVAVGLGEALADLQRDVGGEVDGQLTRLVEQSAQVRPLQELHHEVGPELGGAAHVGDLHDVGVLHERSGARLLFEAPLATLLEQRLQREVPPREHVLHLVDAPCSPFVDETHDAVAPVDDGAWGEVRGGLLVGRGHGGASRGLYHRTRDGRDGRPRGETPQRGAKAARDGRRSRTNGRFAGRATE